MIIVTQGSIKGVGLEVFLRSFSLTYPHRKSYKLICHQDFLKQNLSALQLPFKLENNRLLYSKESISLEFVSNEIQRSTLDSFLIGIKNCKKSSDTLWTLPASKEELSSKEHKCVGHTDYLRKDFLKNELSMFFFSDQLKVLLLTDHISLKEVANSVSIDESIKKINNTLSFLKSNKSQIKNIYISGINPHCGESGLIGNDNIIFDLVEKLKVNLSSYNTIGPISGDALALTAIKQLSNSLLVYTYHDQGLGVFKLFNGFKGINITCGLPFLRVSQDHGTNSDNFLKSNSDISGTVYLFDFLEGL